MENISMDEISTKAFFKFKKTDPAEISKRTCVCIHCSFRKQQCRLKSPIGTAQIINIVSYPIRKKSTFWLFYMSSDKEMYHALFP